MNFLAIIDKNIILMLNNKLILKYLFMDIINKKLSGKFWVSDNMNNRAIQDELSLMDIQNLFRNVNKNPKTEKQQNMQIERQKKAIIKETLSIFKRFQKHMDYLLKRAIIKTRG